MNLVDALIREDIARLYAGHPEEMQEAIDEFEELLSGSGDSVSLYSGDRDAAWAELGG